MESYYAIFHSIYDTDIALNSDINGRRQYGPYDTYEQVLNDMLEWIQYQGLTINYAWCIYGVTKDGMLVKMIPDQNGK
jgi:hypothetical protein